MNWQETLLKLFVVFSEHDIKVELLASPALTVDYNSEIKVEMRLDADSLAFLPYFRLKMWDQTYTQHMQAIMSDQQLNSLVWKAQLTPGYHQYPNGFHLAYEGGNGLSPNSQGLLTDMTVRLDWQNGDSLATEFKINPLTGL